MSMESPSQCAVIHQPPGIAEAPWKRLKSEPKRALDGNPEEDDEFNDPEHQILHYFDADIRIRERLEKDEIEKKEGRIPAPRYGGMAIVGPHFRAEIIQFSKLALEKYNNAKIQKKNQGKMFVFHDLVKATHKSCGMYFITFQAKKAGLTKKRKAKIAGGGGGDGADAILTFLAKVVHAFDDPPRVMSCFLKPT